MASAGCSRSEIAPCRSLSISVGSQRAATPGPRAADALERVEGRLVEELALAGLSELLSSTLHICEKPLCSRIKRTPMHLPLARGTGRNRCAGAARRQRGIRRRLLLLEPDQGGESHCIAKDLRARDRRPENAPRAGDEEDLRAGRRGRVSLTTWRGRRRGERADARP